MKRRNKQTREFALGQKKETSFSVSYPMGNSKTSNNHFLSSVSQNRYPPISSSTGCRFPTNWEKKWSTLQAIRISTTASCKIKNWRNKIKERMS